MDSKKQQAAVQIWLLGCSLLTPDVDNEWLQNGKCSIRHEHLQSKLKKIKKKKHHQDLASVQSVDIMEGDRAKVLKFREILYVCVIFNLAYPFTCQSWSK